MNTITRTQAITVLKHLANGRQPEFVATATHLPLTTVEKIAERHGWPDLDEVRRGIFELTRDELEHTPQAATAPPVARSAAPSAPAPAPGRPDLSVAQKAAAPAAEPARVAPRLAATDELLHMAAGSHKASTRNLGTRINGLLADLAQRLNDEETEHLTRVAAKQERERKAMRIAELKAELAALNGRKPTSTPKAAAAPAGDSKAIRAWATANGVDCPTRGIVPSAVRQAYEQAHQAGAA